MKKSTKIIISVAAVLVVLSIGYIIVFHPEVIGLPSPRDENAPPIPQGNQIALNKTDFEIFNILEKLFGKTLPYAQVTPYIASLHMEVFARDDMNAQQLLQWFEANYAMDGWASQGVTPQYSSDWVAYHEAWTRGTDARSVSIGEGAAVTLAFGHATVYLVSHGPATTYWQFWALVR